MIALSIKQPYAEQIARGDKVHEFRSWPTKHRGPLLVVASRATDAPGYAGEPRGVAVCVVEVTRCFARGDRAYAWALANPRRVSPIAVKGSAAFYHVDDARIVYAPDAPDFEPRAAAQAHTAPTMKIAPTTGKGLMPRGVLYFVRVDNDPSVNRRARSFSEANAIAKQLANKHGCYARAFKTDPLFPTSLAQAFALPPGLA